MEVLHFTRISPAHRVWHPVVVEEDFGPAVGVLRFARCGVYVGEPAEKRLAPPTEAEGFVCRSCTKYLRGDRPIEEIVAELHACRPGEEVADAETVEA